MSEAEWLIAMLLFGGLVLPPARRWYKRRAAAKSADKLLADVLKSKDAFRR
ncbi:MAG TPA: hypothetical protein VLS44_03385 [Nitrospira sp.]|nr:hypothetical protein [Nitrospira sp.]